MKKSERRAMIETLHLFRSSRNAKRLRTAIAEIEGNLVVHAILADEAIEKNLPNGDDIERDIVLALPEIAKTQFGWPISNWIDVK